MQNVSNIKPNKQQNYQNFSNQIPNHLDNIKQDNNIWKILFNKFILVQ